LKGAVRSGQSHCKRAILLMSRVPNSMGSLCAAFCVGPQLVSVAWRLYQCLTVSISRATLPIGFPLSRVGKGYLIRGDRLTSLVLGQNFMRLQHIYFLCECIKVNLVGAYNVTVQFKNIELAQIDKILAVLSRLATQATTLILSSDFAESVIVAASEQHQPLPK